MNNLQLSARFICDIKLPPVRMKSSPASGLKSTEKNAGASIGQEDKTRKDGQLLKLHHVLDWTFFHKPGMRKKKYYIYTSYETKTIQRLDTRRFSILEKFIFYFLDKLFHGKHHIICLYVCSTFCKKEKNQNKA